MEATMELNENNQTQDTQADNTKFTVTDYSDKSFVVSGELTRTYKADLKSLGGKFNGRLRGGPGWIFPMKNKEKVMAFVMAVNSGETPEVSSASIPTMNDIGLPVVEVPNESKYQYVKFKIFKPQNGMTVQLKTSGKLVEGAITQTESSNHDGIIDTVYIDFDGQTSMGVISRGKWQIFGYFADHTIFFK